MVSIIKIFPKPFFLHSWNLILNRNAALTRVSKMPFAATRWQTLPMSRPKCIFLYILLTWHSWSEFLLQLPSLLQTDFGFIKHTHKHTQLNFLSLPVIRILRTLTESSLNHILKTIFTSNQKIVFKYHFPQKIKYNFTNLQSS